MLYFTLDRLIVGVLLGLGVLVGIIVLNKKK